MKQSHIIKISLAGIRPVISRTLRVPSDFTLAELHDAIQLAFGWADCHLHEFRTAEARYTVPSPDEDSAFIDESTVSVDEVLPSRRARAEYIYDLGDDWVHRIAVDRREAAQPDRGRRPGSRRLVADAPVYCLDAKRACPPEDCGGPPGYEDLLDALSNPDHERHDELTKWVGGFFDSESVSVVAINRRLAALV